MQIHSHRTRKSTTFSPDRIHPLTPPDGTQSWVPTPDEKHCAAASLKISLTPRLTATLPEKMRRGVTTCHLTHDQPHLTRQYIVSRPAVRRTTSLQKRGTSLKKTYTPRAHADVTSLNCVPLSDVCVCMASSISCTSLIFRVSDEKRQLTITSLIIEHICPVYGTTKFLCLTITSDLITFHMPQTSISILLSFFSCQRFQSNENI